MRVEKADMHHLDELEILYDVSNDFLSANINYPGWIRGVYPVRQTAEEAILANSLYVLISGGRIAGSVILNHDQETAYREVVWNTETEDNEIWVVHTLVVHPDFLHQGVGRGLLEFAIREAPVQGIKSIRLDVSEHNLPAIALYESCGFLYAGTVDLKLPYDHLKWFKLYEYIPE